MHDIMLFTPAGPNQTEFLEISAMEITRGTPLS